MTVASLVPHPLRPYPPLIINVALTGMTSQRERVPHVPLTAEQIVDDAVACFAAGATVVHLHARDSDGAPDWRHEAYSDFIPEIRRQCPGIVVGVSTSGRVEGRLERRADVLRLDGDARPDMASLTLGSLNFRDSASVNAPSTIVGLAGRMRCAGIRPELEVFDSGMAHVARELLVRGVLDEPLYANLLLGSPGTAPATARDLAHLIDALPPGATWSAAGVGAFQLPMNALAVFLGGHVRTGLEDNPYYDFAMRSHATNVALVQRIAGLAAVAGRSVAGVHETRAAIGLGL